MADSIVPQRRCKKCGNEFPATTEYFYKTHTSLSGKCKSCEKAVFKEYYNAHREQAIERRRSYYQENRVRIRETARKYKADPEKQRKYQKEHYEKNKPRILERQRQYAKSNPEKAREKVRKWNIENPERRRERERRYAEAHREESRNRAKKYRAEHPQQSRVDRDKRRALLLKAEGTYNAEDIGLQIKAQTDKRGVLRCWWCSEPIDGKYHLDHRIPLSKGVSNGARNICITHERCNLSKQNKMPWEYKGRLI
jgi:hypothetical protein